MYVYTSQRVFRGLVFRGFVIVIVLGCFGGKKGLAVCLTQWFSSSKHNGELRNSMGI